jgi:glutamate synthase domain-containing protein 1
MAHLSSGKNLGVFKASGWPEEVADLYRIQDYKGYIWLAHNRYPTNTAGWWGGAHPFNLLDWSVVHNGEITSYGTNQRYIESYGYKCTMYTDTEVVAYLVDLLVRKHGLSETMAVRALAPPFWDEIDRMPTKKQELNRAIRLTYGPALMNGPFAICIANEQTGLNCARWSRENTVTGSIFQVKKRQSVVSSRISKMSTCRKPENR